MKEKDGKKIKWKKKEHILHMKCGVLSFQCSFVRVCPFSPQTKRRRKKTYRNSSQHFLSYLPPQIQYNEWTTKWWYLYVWSSDNCVETESAARLQYFGIVVIQMKFQTTIHNVHAFNFFLSSWSPLSPLSPSLSLLLLLLLLPRLSSSSSSSTLIHVCFYL